MHHKVNHVPGRSTAPSTANGVRLGCFPGERRRIVTVMKRASSGLRAVAISTAVLVAPAERLWAQVAPVPATQPADGADLVTMDFPADGVEVTLLAEIVTKRLHIPILY